MDDVTATALMQRLGKAYFNRDRVLLSNVTTEDAEWHFAFGDEPPDGRVCKGIDGFMRGIEENDALFERLRFNDVKCHGLGSDRIIMTYVVNGKYRNGESITLRGIEVITAHDGRVAKKDVFWKQYRTASASLAS